MERLYQFRIFLDPRRKLATFCIGQGHFYSATCTIQISVFLPVPTFNFYFIGFFVQVILIQQTTADISFLYYRHEPPVMANDVSILVQEQDVVTVCKPATVPVSSLIYSKKSTYLFSMVCLFICSAILHFKCYL